jgi:hypothetical protein
MGALSDGDYTLALLAAAVLGRNTTVHYSWRVDTVAPVPLVVGRPPPFTNSTTARFSFSCSDGEGECGYEYLLLNPQLGAGPGSVWTSLLLPVVDPFLAVTETVASLVTWVRAVGGRRVVVTPNVTLSLATASTLSTAVQFEYSVCHQSCGPAHLLPWSTLPPGESALSLNLPDGEYVMLTRVAGLSVLGSAHPAASVRFSMEAEAPVTYIKGCERDGSARDVTITVGLKYPSSLPLALASAVWYSLDGTPWQFRNHTSTLKLKGLLPGVHTLRLVGVDNLGRLTAHKPVDKFWTTEATTEFPVGTTFSLQAHPPFLDETFEAQFLLDGFWSRLFFWRLNGGPWMLNQDNPKVLLGPSDLRLGELNTWEAVPVTSVTASVSLVQRWISGAPQGSGSAVTMKGLADGDHILLLKARDRAGNLSPSFLQVNWTVDSTAPSNCSITSFNGVFFEKWTQNIMLSNGVNSSTLKLQLAGSLQDKGGPFAAMVVLWWRVPSHSST